MRQVLVNIPFNWPVCGALLGVGVVLLLVAGVLWLRKRQSADAGDPAVVAVFGVGLAGLGVAGMQGMLPAELPIYGYGAMLFVAFVACISLGIYVGKKVGIAPDVFKDVTLWCFVAGILGARVWFFVEARRMPTIRDFFAIWDGGLVLYGALAGGVAGYFMGDYFLKKKFPFDRWKMADCMACCLALGIAIGRVGCLLNGCCYGEVACVGPSITYPLSAEPRRKLVHQGYQTAAGFTLDRGHERRVESVDFDSPASRDARLRPGDFIVKVNGQSVVPEEGREDRLLHYAFESLWPRGKNDLVLTIQRPIAKHQADTIELPSIAPRTLGLHPTQIYETISMTLLLFFLLSYFPYRHADGIEMAIFMLAYGVHRFLDEMLRADNDVVALNMTLSQCISIVVFVGGIVMSIAVWRHAKGRMAPAV